jgi:hypothetical protein
VKAWTLEEDGTWGTELEGHLVAALLASHRQMPGINRASKLGLVAAGALEGVGWHRGLNTR